MKSPPIAGLADEDLVVGNAGFSDYEIVVSTGCTYRVRAGKTREEK